MKPAIAPYPNELSATELGNFLADACARAGTGDRPKRFAILIIHLERSDRGSALANLSQGEEALDEIRRRISEAIRPIDRFGVIGYNEVAFYLPGIDSQAIIHLAKTRLFRELDSPIRLSSRTVLLRPAVGCAFYPDHGTHPDVLLGAADLACSRARALPARLDFVSNAARTEHPHELVEELRTALDHNELEVWLQPQLDTRRCDFLSAEALIRWNRPPGKAPVHAGMIAEMAEQNGLMSKMTDFVLNTALRHLKFLDERGINLSVGINVSASVLSDPILPERVEEALLISWLPSERLTIEVTESSLMEDFEGALKVMWDLKKLGTRLSIDDFGTGYSSLSYLQRMPLDELKIDQVFVRNLLAAERDQQITRSVIDLSHTFGLEAVAEGVESREAMDLLVGEYGCDILQGYYFSKPIPVAQLVTWWPNRLEPLRVTARS